MSARKRQQNPRLHKPACSLRFLITAGGTREYIDPVRFISNASSGKMGYALVRAAIGAGHKVTLLSAVTNLRSPGGAEVIYVRTGREMFAVVKKSFARCDCLIMAAAVCDYTPVSKAVAKIKKTDALLTITLKPTIDILQWAGGHKKRGQMVVGFALEEKNLKACAEKKLKDKNLDMIIANTPAAIGAERTTVWVKPAGDRWLKLGPTAKTTIARNIISLVEQEVLHGSEASGCRRPLSGCRQQQGRQPPLSQCATAD